MLVKPSIEFIMFGLMLDKGLPGRLVKVVADWYGKTVSIVRWNGCFSNSCVIKSGIRQGSLTVARDL